MTKENKEKTYEEYTSLGGVLPLTKDLGTKIINKNIEALKVRTKLLSDPNTTNALPIGFSGAESPKNKFCKGEIKPIKVPI